VNHETDAKVWWIATLTSQGHTCTNYQRERLPHGPFDSKVEAEQAIDAVLLAESEGYV
jgi:hypothetical protein